MLDQLLSWLVLVIPVALGAVVIMVPAKHDDAKSHMRWRWFLGVSLILYGLLVWWQQSRAALVATTDRDKVVADTSAKVSTAVTNAVTEQYKGMIAEQDGQISQLRNQLGNKIDVFSGQTKFSLSVVEKRINEELAKPSTSTLKVMALELAKKIDDFVLVYARAASDLQNSSDSEKRKLWDHEQQDWDKNLQSQVNDVTGQLKTLNLMDDKDNEGASGNGCGFKPKILGDTILPRRVCAANIEKAAEKIP
jgi:hypothetical protein